MEPKLCKCGCKCPLPESVIAAAQRSGEPAKYLNASHRARAARARARRKAARLKKGQLNAS